jgi:hypothetical protein
MISENLPDKDSAAFVHLQMRFAAKLLDPENDQSLAEICNEFNRLFEKKGKATRINVLTLLRWKKNPVFIARKNSLVDRMEDEFAGQIDRKLVQMCLKGSSHHMNIWYNKRGQLINRHQAVPMDSLPKTKQAVDAEIKKLIAATTPLEGE